MATKKAEANPEITVMEINEGCLDVCIVGTSPKICNRMAQKAWFELLAPQRKTAADRAQTIKHNPVREFRDSPYTIKDPSAPTIIGVPASAFKGGMCVAALRIPGVNRTEIEQLVRVPWCLLPLYGVPQLFMSITRSADFNHTPDVRTRAILPEWACRLSVRFMKPALREQSIANLLSAAGFISGVGDWRQEKGSGSFGAYRLCSEDDPDFVRITTTMGRTEQAKALARPVPYDDETSEMLAWFGVEMHRRGHVVDADGVVVSTASAQAQERTPSPRKRRTNGSEPAAAAMNA